MMLMCWLRWMGGSNIQTVTVDRVSNGGNAIAQQRKAGKTIHVPAGEVGEEYEVRLTDEGGYFTAELVNRTNETQPRGPSVSSTTGDLGSEIGSSSRSSSYSHSIRNSPARGKLRATPGDDGQAMRSRMSQRKK